MTGTGTGTGASMEEDGTRAGDRARAGVTGGVGAWTGARVEDGSGVTAMLHSNAMHSKQYYM